MHTDKVIGFAVSPQQQRVLHLAPGRAVLPFVARIVFTIEGPLDIERLESALADVVARHEIFRTQFSRPPGMKTFLQVILPPMKVSIERSTREALVGHNGRHREAGIFREFDFDLEAGQVLRCFLVRQTQEESELLIAAPAVCADAATLKALVRELAESYSGEAPTLIAENNIVQYADVAEHFNEVLRSEGGALGAQYWYPRMAALKAPSISSTKPRYIQADSGFSPRFVHDRIERRKLEKAYAALDAERVSDELLLLTGWQALLRQLSGENEFVIGYAANGREAPEVEGCMGPFERYLPLKISGLADTPFSESLKAVSDTAKEAVRWQKMFTLPETEQYHRVCFSCYDTGLGSGRSGVIARCSGLSVCSDRFELKLSCSAAESEIGLDLWYDPALWPATEAQQLLSQFVTLMEHACDAVAAPIDALQCISEQEQARLLENYSRPRPSAESSGAGLVARIEDLARNHHSLVAIESAGEKLTYEMLNDRAGELAECLRAQGVAPEKKVALYMDRSPELLIALLAVLKAEGAYVPLDPNLPADRIAWMVADAQVHLILSQENLIGRLPKTDVPVESLRSISLSAASRTGSGSRTDADDDNPAYVIYTSGSTGRPKGVVVTRRGLNNYVTWACGAYQCRQGMRVPLLSSLAFDLVVTALWPPLAAGGCVALPPDQEGVEWLAEKGQGRFGLVKITPVQLRMLEQLLPEGGAGVTDRFVIGGEALRWEELQYWRRSAPDARLVNEYGPTETVVGSCSYEIGDWQEEGRVPIGQAIGNTRLYVLNGRFDLTPSGAPGELFIGGTGLARGYLNRPDLTAERFVPDPFSGVAGGRLYRTGDLVRWRAEGEMEYLGRKDGQIKLRGYRIEPGEIEMVLLQYPGISRAVVALREDQEGEKGLAGYVVSDEGKDLDIAAVRLFLNERLPEYMVPRVLMQLEEMPVTPNGKIDYQALPEPLEAIPMGRPPRTVVEELIASIWEEVLNRGGVTRDASFFALGGHSLLATQVVSRIRNVFGVELPLRVIFEALTVAALAEEVEKLRTGTAQPQIPPILRADRRRELPLSHAQERLWFVNQLEPENVAYNVPLGLRLRGELNRTALRRSLAEMVRRHEVLRTSFPARNGVPMQRIADELQIELEETDLRHLTPEQRRPQVERLVSQGVEQVFDLSTGPLLKTMLLQTAEQDHVLLVTMHHIISDGWSVGIMARELGELYGACVSGRSPSPPELKIQYADYACWQREWLQGEVLAEQLAYWKKQLMGMQVLQLPADFPASMSEGPHGLGLTLFEIDGDMTEKLKDLARREGVTLFMFLLAAFKVVLGAYAESRDIAIGTDIANRNHEEIEGLIGFFVNQLVLRTDMSGEITFVDLLKRVRQVTFDAYQRQDTPFAKIVEEMTSSRNADRNPLFGVKFVFQNAPAEDITLTGLQLEVIEIKQKRAKFDLMLTVSVQDPVLVGSIEYRKDLFSQSTARLIQSQFRQVLADIVARPETSLSDLEQKLNAVRTSHRAAQKAELRKASARDLLSAKRREPSLE